MAALDFPSAPTVGLKYPDPIVDGVPQYQWDGTAWIAAETPAELTYVKRAGDTMTGYLTLLPSETAPSTSAMRKDYFTNWTISANAALNAKYDKTGGTLTGNINVQGANATLSLQKTASGQTNSIYGYTNTTPRWLIQLGDGAAEAGSNAGSNFNISRYNDAGAIIDSPLIIERLNGYAKFYTDIWAIRPDNTGLYQFGNTGTKYLFWDGTNFNFVGGPVHGPSISGTNGVSSGADIYATRDLITSGNVNPYGNILFDATYGANRWTEDGNLVVGLGGYKPGGGSWGDSSDARIKNVEGEYAQGLDAVSALRPVRYTFKGNDTSTAPKNAPLPPEIGADGKVVTPPDTRAAPTVPYPNSEHYSVAAEKVFTGLIAQEVETVFPEMVSTRPGFIDGKPVNDIRVLDTTPLIFALVNAVKELKARVEQLENPA